MNKQLLYRVSPPVVLATVLIVLKLAGHLNWGWVWILCPLWIPPALALVLALFISSGFLFTAVMSATLEAMTKPRP
jgi:hypothetical protein